MSATNDGGSAFPVPPANITPNGDALYADPGMSIRDWFAGQALNGMLSDPNGAGDVHILAKNSYIMADAMLEARRTQNDT